MKSKNLATTKIVFCEDKWKLVCAFWKNKTNINYLTYYGVNCKRNVGSVKAKCQQNEQKT